MKKWDIVWSPEGRVIRTVTAKTAKAAKRMTPKPYKHFMGEVYVTDILRRPSK